MNEPNAKPDPVDAALSRRLARLATVPVDSSNLERRLRAKMAEPEAPPRQPIVMRWRRPLAGIAALLLVGVFIGLALINTASPVVAAPTELARVHRDVIAGEAEAFQITSINQANQIIASQSQTAPTLPQHVTGDVRTCCLHRIQGVLVVCLQLEYRGQPVTLVVAHGRELCSRDGTVIQRGGTEYMTHDVEGLNMVMTNQADHWLCVMGELPTDQLVDLAAGIEF